MSAPMVTVALPRRAHSVAPAVRAGAHWPCGWHWSGGEVDCVPALTAGTTEWGTAALLAGALATAPYRSLEIARPGWPLRAAALKLVIDVGDIAQRKMHVHECAVGREEKALQAKAEGQPHAPGNPKADAQH